MKTYLIMDGWPEQWSFVQAESHDDAWQKYCDGHRPYADKGQNVAVIELGERKSIKHE